MRDKLNRSKCLVTILFSLEILAGLILLVVTAYHHSTFIIYVPKTERQTLLSQMSNIYLLGFELLIFFALGFVLWQYICKKNAIVEQSKLLILWNAFSSLAVLCGCVTVWSQYSNIQSLQIEYAASLFQGMDLYFSDPEWKILWDRIQFNYECCGVFGFGDWEEAAWMPDEQIECQSNSDSKNCLVMIPYACCKRSATSCFQKFAPYSLNVTNSIQNSNEININGCLPKFSFLTLQFIYNVAGIWLVCLITQIVLLVFTLCIVSRTKKLSFNSFVCSEDNDDRPLVVVKYPRNVRCITLTDEDNFDEIEEQEEKQVFKNRCQNCLTTGASIRHDIFANCDARHNIFVH